MALDVLFTKMRTTTVEAFQKEKSKAQEYIFSKVAPDMKEILKMTK